MFVSSLLRQLLSHSCVAAGATVQTGKQALGGQFCREQRLDNSVGGSNQSFYSQQSYPHLSSETRDPPQA